MRHLMGLVLAGGILLATAAESKAQFSLSIGNGYGNGYSGQGLTIGNPAYGYGTGYSSYTGAGYPSYVNSYNSYSNSAYLAGPGVMSYSSGYQGYAPAVANYGYAPGVASYGYARPYNGYGYGARPYYGNGGYGNSGYGTRNFLQPFRGIGQRFRRDRDDD